MFGVGSFPCSGVLIVSVVGGGRPLVTGEPLAWSVVGGVGGRWWSAARH